MTIWIRNPILNPIHPAQVVRESPFAINSFIDSRRDTVANVVEDYYRLDLRYEVMRTSSPKCFACFGCVAFKTER